MSGWMERRQAWILALLILVGGAFRVWDLGGSGLAEDEVNKIRAVRDYLTGDFSPNAEHPMVMKLLITVCVVSTDAWNGHVAPAIGIPPVPEEVPIRLPNALVGTLTAIPLFLLSRALFTWRHGLLAAFLWETGINVITINRVAKEDTLLVFFVLWGFYWHLRMKTTPESDPLKRRFYYFSAASFGLMLASKYFPHYYGLCVLFFALARRFGNGAILPDSFTGRDQLRYYAVMATAFLLFNPMVLTSGVQHYILDYSAQGTVTHHGYFLDGQLYFNNIDKTPFAGTPWYFYLLFLAVKTPLLVLGASVAGLAWCLARWRQPGPMLVLLLLGLWLIPYSLVGVKFLRYTLSLMPPVVLAGACGLHEIFRLGRRLLDRLGSMRLVGNAGMRVAVAAAMVVPAFSVAPLYSMYMNSAGGGQASAGRFFPHDEYYDLELREAIQAILPGLPRGGAVAGETPAVFGYYLEKAGRKDVEICNLSDRHFDVQDSSVVYVFLQPGRRYFENEWFYLSLWDKVKPVAERRIYGQSAVRVYRLSGEKFLHMAGERSALEAAHNQR